MTSRAASTLRRALLYVPSSSPKFLEKSRSLTLDTVAYDLEDSVTTTKKPEARKNLISFLSAPRPDHISELAVRINAVSTGLALEDLTAILRAPNLDAICVPKVASAHDLQVVTDILRHLSPERHPYGSNPGAKGARPVKIIALIETAQGIMNLNEICKASPYCDGLVFAAEDFAMDLSITRTLSLQEFLYARSAIATAARAYDFGSTIDLVCTSFRGEQGLKTLEEECLGGKGLGFNGKQCIHPSQIETVMRAFAPGLEELEWAVKICVADEKADKMGRGAWALDGKMVDAPVTGKARAIVKRARVCGLNVEEVRERWKGQEPQ